MELRHIRLIGFAVGVLMVGLQNGSNCQAVAKKRDLTASNLPPTLKTFKGG